MKTIEEAIKELQNGKNYRDLEVGFRQGAEFAQRWIPVEEDNPPIDGSLHFADSKYSISVEVRNGIKIQSAYFNTETGQWRSLITGIVINPTHWRLIDLK